MNDNNGGLYFVVGGIAVVVIGMVMYFGGFMGGHDGTDTICISRQQGVQGCI